MVVVIMVVIVEAGEKMVVMVEAGEKMAVMVGTGEKMAVMVECEVDLINLHYYKSLLICSNLGSL